MIEEFVDAGEGASFETDVCIVGSGAAGLTLARRLVARGIDVCILESGAADYEKSLQDLGIGDNVGFPYYQLDQSRLNYLQAIHDYLVARSAFEAAIGAPVAGAPSPEMP